MALSALQKLLNKSSPPTRILASFHRPILHSPSFAEPIGAKPSENNAIPAAAQFFGSSKHESFSHLDLAPFSPIAPIGLYSCPILLIEDGHSHDDSGMWADSVKKKRKRKMNKHKYKKLRKQLRRKT